MDRHGPEQSGSARINEVLLELMAPWWPDPGTNPGLFILQMEGLRAGWTDEHIERALRMLEERRRLRDAIVEQERDWLEQAEALAMMIRLDWMPECTDVPSLLLAWTVRRMAQPLEGERCCYGIRVELTEWTRAGFEVVVLDPHYGREQRLNPDWEDQVLVERAGQALLIRRDLRRPRSLLLAMGYLLDEGLLPDGAMVAGPGA